MSSNDPAHTPTGQWKAGGDHTSPSSDRDLLFGRLAVLNGFVDDETVRLARSQGDTSRSLADVLVESGEMTVADRDAVEHVLERHVERHGDDPQMSLISLSSATVSFADPANAATVLSVSAPAGGTPPARTFGDYEILETIAEGGMGVVYKARQAKLNRPVALKMIRSGELADEDQIERFYSEARAAARLDHPGIVQVYEVGQQNGQHYFSMAFVEGVSLHDRVKNDGPLPPKRAAELIKTVAEAAQYGHEKGIVHRDIKPHNILLDEFESPRVTDFGLAKHGDSEMTVAGQVMGTPSYMPPEQAQGKQDEISAESDVYSLGATLYYLLTGRPPFQAATPTDTLRQVVNDAPVPPRNLNSDIPRDLETICLKCLRKERHSRYATARQLAEDLDRWLENKPIVARRVSAIEKAWLWCKRKPVVVGAALTVLVVIGVAAYITHENNKQAVKENDRTRAEELVVGLKKADIEQVPAAIAQMKDYRQWADPILESQIAESHDGSNEKLRLSLALLPRDEQQVGYLQAELLKATPAALPIIRDALKPHRDKILTFLWTVLENDQRQPGARFNAACALATYDGEHKTKWNPMLPFVAEQFVESIQNSLGNAGRFQEMLKPIRAQLAKPVSLIARDPSKTELQRNIALTTVLDYAKDDPQRLADVLASAEQRQYARIFDALKTLPAADHHLAALLKEPWSEGTPEEEKERIAQRQANAAVALLKLRKPESVWPLLKLSPDPRTRSYIIHWAAPLGVAPGLFVARLDSESDASIRRALLLMLGEFNERQLPVDQRQLLVKRLLAMYETDRDAGLHGCAEWLLRHWGYKSSIKQTTSGLKANFEQRKTSTRNAGREWYVNVQGQTFTVLKVRVFRMGSPKSEPGRFAERETPHLRTIGRTFAMATYEVTRDQFIEFLKETQRPSYVAGYLKTLGPYTRTPDSPAVGVTWFEAAAYCNWLSLKDGIPKDQWCYEPNAQGHYAAGMKAKKNYLQLTGYRLPTEAEWESACRAGTTTSRYYGLTEALLPKYARFAANGQKHAWPVGGLKPNDLGLFDMLGNATEWCHDPYTNYETADPMQPTPEVLYVQPVTDSGERGIRIWRGGAYTHPALSLRSASRDYHNPSRRTNLNGFRPTRTYLANR